MAGGGGGRAVAGLGRNWRSVRKRKRARRRRLIGVAIVWL